MTAKVLRQPFTKEFLEKSLNRQYQKDYDEGIIILGDTYEEVSLEIDKIYENGNINQKSWFSEIVDFPGPGWRAVGNVKYD